MKKLLFIAACLAVLVYTAVDTKKKPSDVTLSDVGTVAEKTADEIKNSKSFHSIINRITEKKKEWEQTRLEEIKAFFEKPIGTKSVKEDD